MDGIMPVRGGSRERGITADFTHVSQEYCGGLVFSMDDPFFIPGIFASPPKLSDAELRAEAKLEAEREAKRQAQLAAQAVEEMRDRAEELLELIARAERLGVDSSVLSQVREYMAPRGAWPAACKCSLRRPLLPTGTRTITSAPCRAAATLCRIGA